MSKQTCLILKQLPTWLVGVVALALSTVTAQATETLTPHTAEYNVKISVVSGQLRTSLKESETGYIAEHRIAPTGMSKLIARGKISEVSEFAVGDDGLKPVAYRSNDTLSRDKVQADVRFDWDLNRAFGTVNGAGFEQDLAGFSHDRISIQYQLMQDLLHQESTDNYRMFEVDKQKVLSIRTLEARSIKVPAGTFRAIGVQHQAENSSRVTTLWCAEELGYLPVMIEQHRKGKLRVRAKLHNYTPHSAASSAD